MALPLVGLYMQDGSSPAVLQLLLSPRGRLQLKHHQVSKKPSLKGGAFFGPPSPLGAPCLSPWAEGQ